MGKRRKQLSGVPKEYRELKIPDWLGPSSTWAYSQQVIRLLRSHLNIHDRNKPITSVDAQAFTLDWPSVRGSMLQQKADIPSRDYAIYLTNTVKFHLGQTYHLFEESSFLAGVHEYYSCSTPSDPTDQTRLWHVQFLLVMALGQALLAPVTSGKSPASNNLVARALELLPDAHGLYRDPIISIELLCCLSLYLQSIDHRNSAYLYVQSSQNLHHVRYFTNTYRSGKLYESP
jgi:proline utilization trans-activator